MNRAGSQATSVQPIKVVAAAASLALEVLFSELMKCFSVLLCAACLLLVMRVEPALANDNATYTRTNLVDRWITNTTEIQIQVNRFVTEFHTNWVKHVETNYVSLFRTNLVTQYHTNWMTAVRTNWVQRFQTNFFAKTLTNTFVVDQLRTNFVTAFQTNLETLYLTNWTTVVAFKTNWINRPMTNLVQIELPREAEAVASAAVGSEANEPLSLQASRNGHLNANNQVEVQLKVAWRHSASMPLQVQQWRIERADGSILCFGQDLEFKRALPPGTYRVLVKAQRDPRSPLLAALGTLTVTPREVLLEQRPARSNSAI